MEFDNIIYYFVVVNEMVEEGEKMSVRQVDRTINYCRSQINHYKKQMTEIRKYKPKYDDFGSKLKFSGYYKKLKHYNCIMKALEMMKEQNDTDKFLEFDDVYYMTFHFCETCKNKDKRPECMPKALRYGYWGVYDTTCKGYRRMGHKQIKENASPIKE